MGVDAPLSSILRGAVEGLTYAAVLTMVVILTAFSISIMTGGGAARANLIIFVIGWTLLGYATFRLWPSKPGGEDDSGEESEDVDPSRTVGATSRFQDIVHATPPLRWMELPAESYRLSLPAQLFLGSCCVLLTSFLLEALFKVG